MSVEQGELDPWLKDISQDTNFIIAGCQEKYGADQDRASVKEKRLEGFAGIYLTMSMILEHVSQSNYIGGQDSMAESDGMLGLDYSTFHLFMQL